MSLAIPSIGLEFHTKASLTGWIVTGYMFTVAAVTMPFGRLADHVGRKRIFMAGIGVFAAFSSATILLAHSFAITLLFRIFQGVGAAMIYSTVTAIAVDSFPPEKRGEVLGCTVSATYIGITGGPVLGGILIDAFGWRSLFVFSLIVVAIAFIVTFFCFKGLSEEKLCLKRGLNLKLFVRNPNYSLSVLASFFSYSATFAVGYLLSVYLQTNMGFSSRVAGLVLVSQPIVMAIIAPFSGKFSDRSSPYLLASIGMGICAAGLLVFLFLRKTTSLIVIIADLIVVGIGFGIFSPPNTNAIMSSVEAQDYNTASSVLATVRAFGQTASMAIVTLVFSVKIGSATFDNVASRLLDKSMHTCFAIFSGLCFVGIFLSARRHP
ncbi:MAG: MFS transporter [Clostridiales Family XIII bacterium]|nr:MFS transporter [Clostridiales Family XIII bacterium]